MNHHHDDPVARVHAWLDENVRVHASPATLTLSAITLDPETLGGHARIAFDEGTDSEKLTLVLEGDGWLGYRLPMFVSPLGAPASYAAIELNDATHRALQAAVRSLLPQLLAFGLHPDTKAWITQKTPWSMRTRDPTQFDAAWAQLCEPGFSVVWPVHRPS